MGIDMIGRPFSEATLFKFAYSFEQATKLRKPPQSTPAIKK
jgi:Asp-tRNA(Asn)/Glu-tRNA(Gln) amidotransferase A subunit family amidase